MNVTDVRYSGVISNPVVANGLISLVMSLSITVGSGFVR